MAALQDVGAMVRALNARVAEEGRKYERLQREVKTLRREDRTFLTDAEERDKTIARLQAKIEKLERPQAGKQASLHPIPQQPSSAGNASSSTRARIVSREARKQLINSIGGFTPLFARREYHRLDKPSSLRDFVAGLKPSRVKPQVLSRRPWVVTAIEPVKAGEADAKVDVNATSLDAVLAGGNGTSGAKRAPADAGLGHGYGDMTLTIARTLKRERSESPSPLQSPEQQDFRHHHEGVTKRPRLSSDPRASVRLMQGDWRSKPICIRCWQTDERCDVNPVCRACCLAGTQCVRRLCEKGDSCPSSHCPCLHPSQYDENDPRWTTETGRMPPKCAALRMPPKVLGDYYRPCEGDRLEERNPVHG